MAEDNKQFDVVPAMVLNWLVPGAGHWYLGDRVRALVYFISITLTFWIGIAIGGAQSTVNIQANTAWFFAQIFTGGYTILSLLLGHLPGAMPSYSKTLDLATIYTGVAGLLNIYVIFDAMSRAVPEEKQEIKK
jgi:hypothetical protein